VLHQPVVVVLGAGVVLLPLGIAPKFVLLLVGSVATTLALYHFGVRPFGPGGQLLLDGDHDVFGDGSVKILSAPGHTPGHQVLALELRELGPLVLSGDLYHFRKSRELRATPTFNTDRERTLRSMDKIEAYIAERGATLWIEHDAALADSIDLAPAYYQ